MTNYRRKAKPLYKPIEDLIKINEEIRFPEVRVIDEMGEMLGIMPTAQAIKMAFEQEKDLIEINPKAEPPVCKIIAYSKHKYQQSKADALKAPSGDDTKTLRLSVRIAPHDLAVYTKKADEFLEKKKKVKVQIRMRGRERSHPELTHEVIAQFLEKITQEYAFESEPKLLGDSLMCTLKPNKKK